MSETAGFCAARDPADKLAAETLRETAEIQITARHLRNLAVQIGGELQVASDTKTQAYFQRPLPSVPTAPSTPIALACVSVNGGTVQTRWTAALTVCNSPIGEKPRTPS